ncbi:DUF4199 domain-containing protein [uncultured Rikenella sp.]|uniref:DUF4199 domain-containing protein n=1 Tax=uncultured Rikenella sp. TaxID=368003 RepID=UPI0026256A03|nr:DUF4199 domain-containing protein [uncultured Rikenella sp.]
MEEQGRPQGAETGTDRRLPGPDPDWKAKYRAEWLTGGLVLGLALFAVMGLEYLLRGVRAQAGWVGLLLAVAPLAVLVAVLVIYGRRGAALRGARFTYGKAFGFSLWICLLSGIIYGTGIFLLLEVVDPVYFGRTFEQALTVYLQAGMLTVQEGRELMELMHSLPFMVVSGILAMVLQGGFVALFTSAVVRYRVNQ